MNAQVTTIQGKAIPYTIAKLPVGQLELDSMNPRLQYLIGLQGGKASQEQLDEMIWDKDQVKGLAQSIFQNGGVREAIIVVRSKHGTYLVREGNCRTVCCRHLSEQYPGDDRFALVPAHIFDHLSDEDLAVLLADMHVAKKISWDAYEQSKVIFDLYNVYGKPYEWISNHLRISKSKISELLAAYKATTDFLQIHPAPGNVKKFSVFQEVMKKRELRDQYDNSGEFRQKLYKWIDEEKIYDHRQVRELPEILANKEAAKALDEHGRDAAVQVLVDKDPSRGSDLFWKVKAATEALSVAPASDIQDLKAGNPQKIIMLRNLQRAIEDLYTLAGIKS